MRSLRVNETKVFSLNAFTGNLFALESEKEAKNDGKNFFGDCLLILDLLVNT